MSLIVKKCIGCVLCQSIIKQQALLVRQEWSLPEVAGNCPSDFNWFHFLLLAFSVSALQIADSFSRYTSFLPYTDTGIQIIFVQPTRFTAAKGVLRYLSVLTSSLCRTQNEW